MSCGPISTRRIAAASRWAKAIVSEYVRSNRPKRFYYPLGQDGSGGVLALPEPAVRLNDEEQFDNGDTPVKGGLVLI
jgi:hypothetical protein